MKSYPGNVKVRMRALEAMMHMSATTKDNRDQLIDAGVVDILRQGMDDNNTAEYQYLILGVFRGLSIDETSPLTLQSLNANIFDLLIRSRSEEKLQVYGWGSLYQLTKKHDQNIDTFREMGICEELTNALAVHSGSCIVCEQCLLVVKNFIRNKASQDALVNAGICELIVKTMEKFPSEDEKVCFNGSMVLAVISSDDACNGEALREARACEASVHAVEYIIAYNYTNTKVIRSIIQAVSWIWNTKENQKCMIDNGLCSIIVSIIDRYNNKDDVLHLLLDWMTNLTFEREIAEKLAAEMKWELFVKILQIFPTDHMIQETGCATISNFCHNVASTRVILGDAGACEAMIIPLITHPHSDRIVENTLRAIYHLSSEVRQNQERFRTLNVRDTIQRVIDTQKQSKSVAEWGAACLAYL
eukprot:CAMPEP_0185780400 /NCGR_PEP_ID=MMETSP1174-20130828/98967_1 /TAXON_ID=35687 /ORGANISM="Dictyocha speculum, Strain CCMP1381" /LENGTH=415 /DNA_ID=CAMNT_0028469945 /DNA_START=23 /DNA_END=1270 /DNA_ORIENTATION=+